VELKLVPKRADPLDIHLHLDEVKSEGGPDRVGADYSAISETANGIARVKGTDYNNIDISDVCKDVECNGIFRRHRRKRSLEEGKININEDKADILCCGEGGRNSDSGSSSIVSSSSSSSESSETWSWSWSSSSESSGETSEEFQPCSSE